MSVKINSLEIENVKRVRAVKLEPSQNGLTVVGGKNNQGKTSVLDAIAWALGGDRYRPSQAMREGSAVPPSLHIELSNGLIVERKGKNSDLKVIDPSGNKSGQQLLNGFVETFALDLPKFMDMSAKEKANSLLQIIGVGDKLYELEQQEQNLYNRRTAIGQIADQKKGFAEEMTFYPEAPKDLISISDLIRQQQDILARNGENQRKRNLAAEITKRKAMIEERMAALQAEYAQVCADYETAQKSIRDLHDESTAELEQNIADIEAINIKVRANFDRDKAAEEATNYRRQYDTLTVDINKIRQQKTDLLNNADLPLPGLTVEDGTLLYNGRPWDCMSGSDQLKVSTAIVRKINPECGFVLLDKLEQMDVDTMQDFGAWLESEGLQAIATRVSTGDECSIIIEDGYSVTKQNATPQWTKGEF